MLKKLSPLLLLCSFELCADPGPLKAPGYTVPTAPINSSGSEAPIEPIVALDDSITVMPNSVDSVTGNVMSNDQNGTSAYLDSSPSSEYGALLFNSDGKFTYTIYKNSPNISKLAAGEVVTDSFVYTLVDQFGLSATAKLTVTIIGNPVDANGNTIYSTPQDVLYDNVDVEFNDRAADATPLNSGRNMRGSLYYPGDKDWFFLHSAGNEFIKLEVCPEGSSCFGGKSWEVYVFDSAYLTPKMDDDTTYPFRSWLTETGSPMDLYGDQIISGWAGPYSFIEGWGGDTHMYLDYVSGTFYGALIAMVDPCFDKSNYLEFGVGPGERDYLIAVSSTLRGSDDNGKPVDQCGVGSVVLQGSGNPVVGKDASGNSKTYETTWEYIEAFPWSDDQYTIKVTSTGLDPLDPLAPALNPFLSVSALEKSSTFNVFTSELNIPKVKVDGKLYSARLVRQGPFSGDIYNFALAELNELGPEETSDPFQATYNPANGQVLFPRVTDTGNGDAYSVVMQYHPPVNGNAEWFQTIAIQPIK